MELLAEGLARVDPVDVADGAANGPEVHRSIAVVVDLGIADGTGNRGQSRNREGSDVGKVHLEGIESGYL